jgi:hypothetical protein
MTRQTTLALIAIAGLLVLSGCGGQSDGPQRYQIHGTVTAKGQPVKEGRIFFSPDTEKGNSGPGAMAFIRDGEYETQDGHGIVGGPHIVDILGWDETVDPESDAEPAVTVKQILPIDLPEEGGNHDFTL